MALDLFFGPSFWEDRPNWNEQLVKSSNPTDIVETKDAFQFSLEAPGFKPEDVQIDLKGDALSISGKHVEADEVKGEDGKLIRRERKRREFSRTFTLPSHVRPDDISASLEHGILNVRVPKAEQAKARRIEVKSA